MGRKLEKRIEDLEAVVEELKKGGAHQGSVDRATPDKVVVDRVAALEEKIQQAEQSRIEIVSSLTKEIALMKNKTQESGNEAFSPQLEDRIKSAEMLLQDIDSRVKVIKTDLGTAKGRLTKLEKKK